MLRRGHHPQGEWTVGRPAERLRMRSAFMWGAPYNYTPENSCVDPDNDSLEDGFPLPTSGFFQGPC